MPLIDFNLVRIRAAKRINDDGGYLPKVKVGKWTVFESHIEFDAWLRNIERLANELAKKDD